MVLFGESLFSLGVYYSGESESLGGGGEKLSGVIKDKELKLKQVEASLTHDSCWTNRSVV